MSKDASGPLPDHARGALLLREASADDLIAELQSRGKALVVARFAGDSQRGAFFYGDTTLTLGLATWAQALALKKARAEDGDIIPITDET